MPPLNVNAGTSGGTRDLDGNLKKAVGKYLSYSVHKDLLTLQRNVACQPDERSSEKSSGVDKSKCSI